MARRQAVESGQNGAVAVDSGPGRQLTDMLRRLRARPVSSWSVGDRERAARAGIQQLADLAADAASEPRRAVPDAGVMALADQIAVLATDARSAGASEQGVTEILDRLAAELGVRG